MHILSCLMVWQNGERMSFLPVGMTNEEYVAAAFESLVKLSPRCEYAGSVPTLLDASFSRQLIDAANMALLALSGPMVPSCLSVEELTLPFAIRRMSFRASIVAFSIKSVQLVLAHRQQQEKLDRFQTWRLAMGSLQLHPKGHIFIEVAMEATRTILRSMRVVLLESIANDDIVTIGYHAGVAIQIISEYFTLDEAYEWYMAKEQSGASILRLICSCLMLVTNPLTVPPFKRVHDPNLDQVVVVAGSYPYLTSPGRGCVEHLAARGFAILLLLGEKAESFFDMILQTEEGKALANEMKSHFIDIINEVLLRPSISKYPISPGEGQLAINVLRAAELLSDESNFKESLIPRIAPTISRLLSFTEPKKFASFWGPGVKSVIHLGSDKIHIGSPSPEADVYVGYYDAAAKKWKNPYYQGMA